jgi:uncharacterized protein YhfF
MNLDDLPRAEFAFPGPLRDQLVAAILAGTKTSTSSLVLFYERENEPLPTVGQRMAVVDSEDRRVAAIELTEVRVVRLADVDLQHALDEGEGDESVAQWRSGHEQFWHSAEVRAELGDPDFTVNDDTLVLAQRFRLVHLASFGRSDDLRAAQFVGVDLQGARFVDADLSGVVMRGVELHRAEIDSPWLFERENVLLVNGVDVLPHVEAELNRRFPGRADRRAEDPEGLRTAWAMLERTWAATLARVAGMPAGTVDMSVGGEWSFAQTLRHLVLATDMWLGRAILEIEKPFHPIGKLNADSEDDGLDMSVFTTVEPAYAEVLEVRAGRVAMVRDFLATVTSDVLAATRRNPHAPDHEETVLSCLHVILDEEWEHHRYAVRDLDAIEAKPVA